MQRRLNKGLITINISLSHIKQLVPTFFISVNLVNYVEIPDKVQTVTKHVLCLRRYFSYLKMNAPEISATCILK